MRFLLILLALLGPVSARAAETPSVPEDFETVYEGLSALVDSESAGFMEMAKGTMDATRFFAVGKPGLARLAPRFQTADTLGKATVAGLYLALWGGRTERDGIRGALEQDSAKRRLVWPLAGTEANFFAALESGAAFQPLVRLLPATAGPRALARECMASNDPLTRRAGLYWGYWLEDASYRKDVQRLAQDDPDDVTKRIAARLLRPTRGDAE